MPEYIVTMYYNRREMDSWSIDAASPEAARPAIDKQVEEIIRGDEDAAFMHDAYVQVEKYPHDAKEENADWYWREHPGEPTGTESAEFVKRVAALDIEAILSPFAFYVDGDIPDGITKLSGLIREARKLCGLDA